nr:hypothetical protein [Tanacetum cinerariifolium]
MRRIHQGRYVVFVPALTKDHEGDKINTSYPEKTNTPYLSYRRMEDPNITMKEYIRVEEEKARKRGKMFNWETAKYGKIWYDEDIHDLRSIDIEFPAITFSDEVSSEKTLSCEPTARLEEACTITMNERCSAVLLNKLPSKEKDPESFTIPCDIGQLHINNALADLGANFVILDMPKDFRVPKILGRPFLATDRAMINVFNKKITLRIGDDEVIFKVDQSIKRPSTKDDECYGIDDLDETINTEAQELLANYEPDLFLTRGMEKSIDQSDLERCKSVKSKVDDNSDSEEPIRRIVSINRPYSGSHEIAKHVEVKREHLYSASANKIDEKKPELKDLLHHLEYAYLHGEKSFPILISSKLSEKEKNFTFTNIGEIVGNKMHKAFSLPDPTNTDPDNTTTRKDDEQSGRTITITTKDMQRKKNDVKARTTILLSLPDEHQLRFSKYKIAKELWAAILKTFGGNEATKKRKKNLLKQQYGNFKAKGSETLEQTFNRLQVIHIFPTASASVATISQDTASAYIASQSNGSQIKFEDINQIDEDDMEEMDIK